MKKIIIASILSVFFLSSCFVNRTTVGYGPVGANLQDRTYSKVKQHYTLLGLIRLNHAQPKTPPAGMGYEIKTKFSIEDIFLSILFPIFAQRTVVILVNKQDEEALKLKQTK